MCQVRRSVAGQVERRESCCQGEAYLTFALQLSWFKYLVVRYRYRYSLTMVSRRNISRIADPVGSGNFSPDPDPILAM